MEEIIIQSGHVGIYDGDVKQVSLIFYYFSSEKDRENVESFQTTYEQGTASLTLHRIIWADSNDPVSSLNSSVCVLFAISVLNQPSVIQFSSIFTVIFDSNFHSHIHLLV